jgi:hypothetical protein
MLHGAAAAANSGVAARIRTANHRTPSADDKKVIVMGTGIRVVIGVLCFLLHCILTLTG